MAESKFSCIKQVVKTVQIALPATFIFNEISGIVEILDSWKRQYSKQLRGVVVNYKNHSILDAAGFTLANKPFVHYKVKATFDLFCPKIGDIVKAKINRISKEHIVLLIEDTINVSIHLSKDSPNELAPFVYLNSEILFEVSSFSCDQKMVLSVKGKITNKCIQLMKELFPAQTFSNLIDTPELSNNTDEGIGTSIESAYDGLLNHTLDGSKINDVEFKKPLASNTKSKKKSSKKSKRDSETSMDTSDVSTSNKKPKKKKKKHNDKSNPDMVNNLNVNTDEQIQNFSSFNHSDILEVPEDAIVTGALLSSKKEISSPIKTTNNFVPVIKGRKKSKDKKSKEKDKIKKKKSKIHASGAVLKKDKRSKRGKLDGEQSKKHKKSKSHKRDKSDKKKRKDSSERYSSNIFI